MGTTLDLQNKLKSILGSNYVYFQPTSSIRMKYPCFLVERSGMSQFNADNKSYINKKQYTVTYISNEQDPDMIDTVLNEFEMCKYARPFVSDNLYHDPFVIYW